MPMKKFILRCGLFLLPMVVLLAGAELLLRSLPNSYRQKEQWMQQNAGRVEVLLLGNSHGLFGLRPDAFGTAAYNLCNVSQTFEYDEWLLQRFLPDAARLKTVVLVADNSNFFDPPLEQTEWFRCIYYRLYMHYPKHSLLSRYGFELASLSAAREKLMRGGDDSCDSLGWNSSYVAETRNPADLTDAAAARSVERHRCRDWQTAAANASTLQRIARLCRRHGVQLVLVQAPVARAYINKVDRRQLDFVRRTCRATGALVVDASADARFSEADFYDADHLNTDGAAKWSRVVADAVDSLCVE